MEINQELSELAQDVQADIGNLDDKILAVSQGKSTNYYSGTDPSTSGYTIKEGDCWFDTSLEKIKVNKSINPAVNENGSFNTAEHYINYYWRSTVQTDENGDPLYVLLDETTIQELLEDSKNTGFTLGETPAYTEEKNCLKQWDGTKWIDIGGELVANKITANYINALDITAKKITVLGSDNASILFQADGNNSTAAEDRVQIAGFKVHEKTLTTGSTGRTTAGTQIGPNTLIQLNSDSTSPYSFHTLTTNEYKDFINGYNADWSIKPFQKADSLWLYNDKHYLAFSAENASANPYQYAITKVTFNQDVTQDFTFYIRDTVDEDYDATLGEDYVIISKLSTDFEVLQVPTTYASTYTYAHTKETLHDTLVPVMFKASETAKILSGAHFYIVYRHNSENTLASYKGQVYLPVDIRMSIGDNFQVLADGSVYAKNLFLGGVTSEPEGAITPASSGETPLED